jgi:hypothetical protein
MRNLSRLAVACVAAALMVVGLAARAEKTKADAFAKAAAEGLSFQAQAARLAGGVFTKT